MIQEIFVPLSTLAWVDRNLLKPNDYNPNKVSSHRLQSFSIVNGKIKIYEGLKVGENVYLLRFNNGEKYYVLDRKE